MSALQKLIDKRNTAEKAVIDELARLYPKGTSWYVNIRHGQINPSLGKVSGHKIGYRAMLSMEFDTKKRRFRYRDVAVANVLYQASTP